LLNCANKNKDFKWSKPIENDIKNRAKMAIEELNLTESADFFINKFKELEIPETWIKENRRKKSK